VSKKSELPQSRRHIMIFDEDWEFIDQYYGPRSDSRLGTGTAIRNLIHRAVVHLKSEAQRLADHRARAGDSTGAQERE
jgi:hypothetical protein